MLKYVIVVNSFYLTVEINKLNKTKQNFYQFVWNIFITALSQNKALWMFFLLSNLVYQKKKTSFPINSFTSTIICNNFHIWMLNGHKINRSEHEFRGNGGKSVLGTCGLIGCQHKTERAFQRLPILFIWWCYIPLSENCWNIHIQTHQYELFCETWSDFFY